MKERLAFQFEGRGWEAGVANSSDLACYSTSAVASSGAVVLPRLPIAVLGAVTENARGSVQQNQAGRDQHCDAGACDPVALGPRQPEAAGMGRYLQWGIRPSIGKSSRAAHGCHTVKSLCC